ncbi:MAG: hypothetical protein ACXACI_15055 [Candidatus Hodarchaeales archaeon]|jgi:hypothetical protein
MNVIVVNKKKILKIAITLAILPYFSFYIILPELNEYNFSLTNEIDKPFFKKLEPDSYHLLSNNIISDDGLDLKRESTDSEPQWIRIHGKVNITEKATAALLTDDGGLLIAGYTQSNKSMGSGEYIINYDMLLVKTNGSGFPEWNRTYGGLNDEIATALVATMDNNFLISGYTVPLGTEKSDNFLSLGYTLGTENYDIWLVKVNRTGYQLWNRTYGGPRDDKATSMVLTEDGGILLAGHTTKTPNTGHAEIWIIKTDSNGNMEWNKTYGGVGHDRACSVIQTKDGGFAIAGWTCSFTSVGAEDMYLIKTDAYGDKEWSNHYGYSYFERAFEILQTADDGYLLAGYTRNEDDYTGAMYLVKTDINGDLEWSCTPGKNYHPREWAFAIHQTVEGDYILAGGREPCDRCGPNAWVVKINGTGEVLWEASYDIEFKCEALAMVTTEDESIIIVGYTFSFKSNSYDILLMKINPNQITTNLTFKYPIPDNQDDRKDNSYQRATNWSIIPTLLIFIWLSPLKKRKQGT